MSKQNNNPNERATITSFLQENTQKQKKESIISSQTWRLFTRAYRI